MRDFLGPDLPLMVDANMRWSVNQATEAAKAFADYNIYWLEEPVIPEDFQGHRRVLAEGGIPIASGENLHTIYEFEKLITAGGVSYPEPDVANVGGITIWRKVAQMAEQAGLPVTSHGVHDLHVPLVSRRTQRIFFGSPWVWPGKILRVSTSNRGGVCYCSLTYRTWGLLGLGCIRTSSRPQPELTELLSSSYKTTLFPQLSLWQNVYGSLTTRFLHRESSRGKTICNRFIGRSCGADIPLLFRM